MTFSKEYDFMKNEKWFYYDEINEIFKLTDLAPDAVKPSYEEYLQMIEEELGGQGMYTSYIDGHEEGQAQNLMGVKW